MLQRVAACCSALQCVAACRSFMIAVVPILAVSTVRYVAACCSVLQCVAVCGSVWQLYDSCRSHSGRGCCEVCGSVRPCVAVCCSVLRCVAVCCIVCSVIIAVVPILAVFADLYRSLLLVSFLGLSFIGLFYRSF